MDFYFNLAVSVFMQILRDPKVRFKHKRAIFKVFREIALQFRNDPEFKDTWEEVHRGSSDK